MTVLVALMALVSVPSRGWGHIDQIKGFFKDAAKMMKVSVPSRGWGHIDFVSAAIVIEGIMFPSPLGVEVISTGDMMAKSISDELRESFRPLSGLRSYRPGEKREHDAASDMFPSPLGVEVISTRWVTRTRRTRRCWFPSPLGVEVISTGL